MTDEYRGYNISTGRRTSPNGRGEWFAAAHPPGSIATRKGSPGIRGFDTEQEAIDAVHELIDTAIQQG